MAFKDCDYAGSCSDIDEGSDIDLQSYTVSNLSSSEIVHWLTNEDNVSVDKNIYRAVVERLMESFHKFEIDDAQNKELLRECLQNCFRCVSVQCGGAEDVKILKTLLQLQRELAVTALQQFEWLCSLPEAFREKWALLASVIPALKRSEVAGNVERSLMSLLWRAQAHHNTGSITFDCLFSWFTCGGSEHSTCAQFLANCLTSLKKVRRLNCSRFWLAKLSINSTCKLIMEEAATIIMQMVQEQKEHYQQPVCSHQVFKLELRELNSRECFSDVDEENEIWSIFDCLLHAWISIKKFFISVLEADEIWLLRCCLTSYYPSVRLESFQLSVKLMNKKMLSHSNYLETFFVKDNLGTSNSYLSVALLNFVQRLDFRKRDYLQSLLLEELDVQNNPCRIRCALELLIHCGLDLWMSSKERINILFDSASPEIRATLLEYLFSEQPDLPVFLLNKFKETLSTGDTNDIMVHVKALLRFMMPKQILDVLSASTSTNMINAKTALISLLQYADEVFLDDFVYWLNICFESNIEMVTLSGSKAIWDCASLPDLYKRLCPSIIRSPTLLISAEQRIAIDGYYRTLKINCELLACLCETVKTVNMEYAYDSVWNVLMRSRHKGVVDDCAVCFRRITVCCLANNLLNLVYRYLEKTKKLFVDESCTTRNLAFCWTFKTFYELLGKQSQVLDYLIGNVCICSLKVAVRFMKVLKALLCTASFDIAPCAVSIFNSVLKLYRTGNTLVRSAACHCFAALVKKLMRDMQHGMPLFIFIASYGSLWDEFCQQLQHTSVHDLAFILLLSLLEKIYFVSTSFYTKKQLRQLELVLKKLISLLIASPNLRINRLIINCLLQLVLRRHVLLFRLKRILEQNLQLNIRIALSYAHSKIEEMNTWDSPSDSVNPSCSCGIASLPRLICKTQEFILEGKQHNVSLITSEHLLEEIEKYAYSAKELQRLHAAHALVILSHKAHSVFLRCPSLRNRFFNICYSLLSDEVECVRRIASRLRVKCSLTSVNMVQCASNPAVKLRELICCHNGDCSHQVDAIFSIYEVVADTIDADKSCV